jgi:hypothetical protein
MRRGLAYLTLAVLAAGCSGGSDSGDVAAAEKAAASQPRSVSDIPAGAAEDVKTQTASAIGQRDAIKAQMDAQAAGMKAAQARAN